MDRWTKKLEKGNRRILPLDVTVQILCFLPAKSLVRFRRVCKLWHSITLDPHFIETHLQIRSRAPPIIFLIDSLDPDRVFIRLDCFDDPSARLNRNPVISRDLNLHASCNGLLCLFNYRTSTTLVVNPLTGDSLTLPPICLELHPSIYFGFEPTTKEYKVLRFSVDDEDDEDTVVCQMFTLGTDSSWRQIHASHDIRPFWKITVGRKGVAVKGAIYWLSSLNRVDQALRFDLLYERFDQITIPCFQTFYGESNYLLGHDFSELQGSLCLPVFPNTTIPDPNIMPMMDIWVMTKQEWSIKYSIMFPWDRYAEPTPLFIHKDKILVHDFHRGSRLQYHDLHTTSYKEVYHQDEDDEPFVHVESLVPLPS